MRMCVTGMLFFGGLVGCGLGGEGRLDDVATSTVPTPLTQAWGSDPMLGTYPEDKYWHAVQECVGEVGFDIDLSAYWTEEPAPEGIRIVAAVLGPQEDPPPDPLDVYLNSLNAQQQQRFNAALYGADETDGGCLKQSRLAVLGYADITPEMNAAFDEIRAAAAADESVIRAKEAWSDCMAEAGFDFENRTQLLEDLQARADRLLAIATEAGVDPSIDTPGAREDVAFESAVDEANTTCINSTDIDNVERAAVSRAQTDYLDAHPDFAHPVG